MARSSRRATLAAAVLALVVTGCGAQPTVDYGSGAAGKDALVIYAGAGDDKEILRHVIEEILPETAKFTVLDAPADANDKIAAGTGDLAFFQHIPAFEADREQHPDRDLSIVSKVNVVPYALYSSKWRDLAENNDWLNVGLVADSVTGQSLPHGAQVVLPVTPTGFARGLYLLQSAGLVKLDRPFGGVTAADLTITQANVVDSLRHLSLKGLAYDDYIKDLYRNYDAVVLNPADAKSIGLEPAKDALAIEPGPGNPYAHVLVAPSRLAGDPRVLELTHALESPRLAQFLTTRFHGANIAVTAAAAR